MERMCKCHGVSGSCTTQTCWMRVADFRTIGRYLKDAYRKAIKMSGSSSVSNDGNLNRVKKGISDQIFSLSSISTSLVGINDNAAGTASKSKLETEIGSLPSTRLAYSEESPNYCFSNVTVHSMGTLGRQCSRRKGKEVPQEERRSCRNLCRSCGYRVRKERRTITTTCNCKFHWCCQVKCDQCTKEEVSFRCTL